MTEEGGGSHGDGSSSSAAGSAQRQPPPLPAQPPQPGSQAPPAPALVPDQLPQNNTLVALPIVAIENILSFMSYDEISQLRLVRPRGPRRPLSGHGLGGGAVARPESWVGRAGPGRVPGPWPDPRLEDGDPAGPVPPGQGPRPATPGAARRSPGRQAVFLFPRYGHLTGALRPPAGAAVCLCLATAAMRSEMF